MITSLVYLIFALSVPKSVEQQAVFAVHNVQYDSSNLEDQEKEYSYLSRQIDSLTNLKDYYMAKATRIRNRASRYQYQNGGANYPDAKKLWREADEYDNIVKRIDEELLDLQNQRSDLAKKIQAHDTP